MKKILFTALIATSLITSAFAGPVKKVNYSVSTAFQTDFPSTKNVQWDVTAEYAKATFVKDDLVTEAFYKLNGDFIGTSQAITLDKLPTAAKRIFAKKYSDYIVKEAIEFVGNEETAYFISAENATKTLILKVVNGAIATFKVSNKN